MTLAYDSYIITESRSQVTYRHQLIGRHQLRGYAMEDAPDIEMVYIENVTLSIKDVIYVANLNYEFLVFYSVTNRKEKERILAIQSTLTICFCMHYYSSCSCNINYHILNFGSNFVCDLQCK